MINVYQIDTAQIAPDQRLDSWNGSISEIYGGISIDAKSHDLRAKALHAKLGKLGLARVVSEESKVYRNPAAIITASEEDYLKLHFQNGGASLNRQGGREALIHTGEITICENKTPYEIETSNQSDIYALSIPRSLADKALPMLESQVMQVFNGYSLHGRLLFNMLHTIYNECLVNDPNVNDTSALENAIIELVSSVLSEQPLAMDDRSQRIHHHQLERLKTLVQENLSNTALTTEFLAQETGISERKVQALFTTIDTTPTIYIRLQRLNKASELLQFEPNLSVTQIAFRTGFNDAAYFTRCFKKHFCETPKSYRARNLLK